MNPAQMANMRMAGGMPGGSMMNVQGPNGLMTGAGGVMGPPVLPRTQQPNQAQLPGGGVGADMGMAGMNGVPGAMSVNGMQAPGMARQPSVGDIRANNAVAAGVPGAANAAGLSINTNLNSSLNAAMPMVGTPSMSGPPLASVMATLTPTAAGSPNPAMLVDPSMSGAPATPNRQLSQPPPTGSPFPGGMIGTPGSAERKMGGPGVLAGAPPLSRVPTGDAFSGTPAPASSAAATTTNGAAPASQAQPQIIPQLPPLPANVNLNPKVTRVSVVPLKDSETTIAAIKEEEIERVKEWMQADKEYEAQYKKMRERMAEEVREAIVKPRAWYEKDPLEDPRTSRRRKEKFDLIGLKGKEDNRRKKAGRREGFKL